MAGRTEINPDLNILVLNNSANTGKGGVFTGQIHNLLRRLEELQLFPDTELVFVLADPWNIKEEALSKLKMRIKQSSTQVKLVYSAAFNNISTNRNLGFLEAAGEYVFFLDDDVRAVGNVVGKTIESFEKDPSLGVIGFPSFNPDGSLYKPRAPGAPRHEYAKDLMLLDSIGGMFMAIRSRVMYQCPFVDFWPNHGEDTQFTRTVASLGFLNAFLVSEDTYLIHEHVVGRVTNNSDAFLNMLLNYLLQSYLDPEFFELRSEELGLFRMKRAKPSLDDARLRSEWGRLKAMVRRILNGSESEESGASDTISDIETRKIIDYFMGNRQKILDYKTNIEAQEIFIGRPFYENILDVLPDTPPHSARVSDDEIVESGVAPADGGLVKKGGIDLTRDKMGLDVRSGGEGIQFQFDPAMIQQLQNASGLTPVVIDIQPMTTTLPMFLGLKDDVPAVTV